MSATAKPFKAHCNLCGGERNAEILCTDATVWEDSTSPDGSIHIWGKDTASMVKCKGCDTHSLLLVREFSEWDDFETEQWPPVSKRTTPSWVNSFSLREIHIKGLFHELYICLDNGAVVLACIGIRTILDAVAVVLGVNEKLSFAKKLYQLRDEGKISESERVALEVVTDAGSAAAHRAWHPNQSEIHNLVDLLENFVERTLEFERLIPSLKQSVPKRK